MHRIMFLKCRWFIYDPTMLSAALYDNLLIVSIYKNEETLENKFVE